MVHFYNDPDSSAMGAQFQKLTLHVRAIHNNSCFGSVRRVWRTGWIVARVSGSDAAGAERTCIGVQGEDFEMHQRANISSGFC